MSAEPTRLFTLNEANATLPLVRAITQDLAESSFEVFERHQQFNRVMVNALQTKCHDLAERFVCCNRCKTRLKQRT